MSFLGGGIIYTYRGHISGQQGGGFIMYSTYISRERIQNQKSGLRF